MLNILTWDTEVNGSEVYLWHHPWWNPVGSVIELSFQIIFYDPDESLQNIGMFTQLHMNTNCPTASNPWNKTQLIPTWCYPVWPSHRFKKKVAFACHFIFSTGEKNGGSYTLRDTGNFAWNLLFNIYDCTKVFIRLILDYLIIWIVTKFVFQNWIHAHLSFKTEYMRIWQHLSLSYALKPSMSAMWCYIFIF